MASQSDNNRPGTVPSGPTIPTESAAKAPAAPRSKTAGPVTRTVNRAPTGPTAQARRAERRPEMIRQQRQDRRQAVERQQRQWAITKIGLAAFAVFAVAGIGFWIYSFVQDQRLNQRPDGTQDYPAAGNEHTASLEEPVQYAQVPPAGGRHAPAPYWQNCGYYEAPIRNESGVHSLEHGAVWITYRPDLPQEQVDILREKAEQPYMLVSPYPDLPSPVVATSWGHQLPLESADDERLDQFIRYFKEGPDTPEPGAACHSGVDTTL